MVANGDIFNMSDVKMVCEVTGADGVMSARGMLQNPAMFAGYTQTPLQCIREWVRKYIYCNTYLCVCYLVY